LLHLRDEDLRGDRRAPTISTTSLPKGARSNVRSDLDRRAMI
jgi:hypothetical protein